MAKEMKKGEKKVAAKKATKKVVPAKKTNASVRTTKNDEKKSNIISIVYMFLLILGISLVFVCLVLKFDNSISNSTTLSCLGIALASIIISVFVKRLDE